MGHNPIPPHTRQWLALKGASEYALTESEIEEERLRLLREMYATGKLTFEQHERAVETVLRGEQPDGDDGLPMMPDPVLYGGDRIDVGVEWR